MIVLVKDGTESPLDGNSVPEVNDFTSCTLYFTLS